uniref:RagB/SusD family nutrient uptake outer membrane protein n=1 Tax=Ornithobacterium rhinotracheale TaxID=28251 RepID=UPI00129C937C|nr:RagB/SusD family nutrient uptake outer membrane protein [Ornithobacterium rhinotracheale]
MGRATKHSAQGFLAKTYWLMACHAQSDGQDASEYLNKSKKYGDLVINSGKYSLDNNYANLFKSHVGKSSESVFQLNFSNANGPQNRSNFYYGPQANFAISGAKSWGNICMDRAFYDFHKGTYSDDPRIKSIYMSKVALANGNEKMVYPYFSYRENVDGKNEKKEFDLNNATILNGDRKNPKYDLTQFPTQLLDVLKKAGRWNPNKDWFWPYNAKMADANTSATGYDTKNMIILRYADILLLMADVENELGNKGVAVEYLNRVLSRARTSGGAKAVYPENVDNKIAQDALREKIFFERMFEMAGEPDLFEDVRRRGTEYLEKVIDIHNNNYFVKYIISVQGGNPWVEYLINGGSVTNDFLKKNLLLPIPSKEINYNSKITQADQNFGY